MEKGYFFISPQEEGAVIPSPLFTRSTFSQPWKRMATTPIAWEKRSCCPRALFSPFVRTSTSHCRIFLRSASFWSASPPICLSSRRKNKQPKRGGQHWFAVPLGILSYYICVRPHPEISNPDLHATIGGVLQEEIFLKVRFQKRVGNSPTKSDFDFGRRTCRLWTPEGQK